MNEKRITKTITFDTPKEKQLLAELEKMMEKENLRFATLVKKLLMDAVRK